jgi:formate dehydrogenase iron-sulfur subunit
MHCLEPNCAAACLVGAIEKTPDGPVRYEADKCIGCRYCMLACPFHIPRYQWKSTEPLMKKCDMCADRIAEGDAPVCVAACTHGALEFGDRDALIEKARVLIHDHPDRYRDHIWGEAEWGGTCIIYISSEDLNALGWPSPSTHAPISALTDPLIHATPIVGISIFLGSVGLGAIIARRNKLMNQAKRPSDVNTAADADTDADRQEAGDAE